MISPGTYARAGIQPRQMQSALKRCPKTRREVSMKHAADHFLVNGNFVGCCFIPAKVFEEHCTSHIGREDHGPERAGQWVFPITYLNKISERWVESGSLHGAIEKTMNFPVPHDDIKLCIYEKSLLHVEPLLPFDTTPGANSSFVFGGYTHAGVPELVIPRANVSEYKVVDMIGRNSL